MQLTLYRMFLTSLIGLLLGSCAGAAGGYYAPRIRDVTEEPIDGNYWYQKFTLYDPAVSASDCQMSRTGQKFDLNSPAELAEIWRKFCRITNDHESQSGNN